MAKGNRGSNKSTHAQEQSAARLKAQKERDVQKFAKGSGGHHDGTGRSGQPMR